MNSMVRSAFIAVLLQCDRPRHCQPYRRWVRMHTVHDYGALVPSRSEPGHFDARRPSRLGVQVTWGEPRASPRCGYVGLPGSGTSEPYLLLRQDLGIEALAVQRTSVGPALGGSMPPYVQANLEGVSVAVRAES